jgi:hypothetical protein
LMVQQLALPTPVRAGGPPTIPVVFFLPTKQFALSHQGERLGYREIDPN